jgi:hypothetical protein
VLEFSDKDKYMLHSWYMDNGSELLHGKQLAMCDAIKSTSGRRRQYVKLVNVDYVFDTEHESRFTCPDFWAKDPRDKSGAR